MDGAEGVIDTLVKKVHNYKFPVLDNNHLRKLVFNTMVSCTVGTNLVAKDH